MHPPDLKVICRQSRIYSKPSPAAVKPVTLCCDRRHSVLKCVVPASSFRVRQVSGMLADSDITLENSDVPAE